MARINDFSSKLTLKINPKQCNPAHLGRKIKAYSYIDICVNQSNIARCTDQGFFIGI